MVSDIVHTFIVREYQEELYQKDVELGKCKDKIDELINNTKEVKIQNEGLKIQNDELITYTKELKGQNEQLIIQTDRLGLHM